MLKIEPSVLKPRGEDRYFPYARVTHGFVERRIRIGTGSATRHEALQSAKFLLEDEAVIQRVKDHFHASIA